MTEQRKIPVPPSDGAKAVKGNSLIERAAGKLDFTSFAPPPVPGDLGPEKPRRAVHRQPETPALAQAEQQPAPDPIPDVLHVPSARTGLAEPCAEDPVEDPVAETVPVTAALRRSTDHEQSEPVVQPVRFRDERHPVDRKSLRDQGLIVPEGKVTALLEEFRIVKRKIMLQASDLRQQGGGALAQRILISSPHPNEGKTFCALNLALAIAAEKESEVLLVDADFAKPSVLTALGLPGGPGLMDALADNSADVADFVIGTDIPGLWVLPAGDTTNSDTEYLGSSRTARVLDRLTEGTPQRLVVVDSPPALAASPAAELAKYVGQVIMVARADQTGQGALEDAISLLSGCPNIELLLNAVHFSPSGRSFGTYYGYGG